MEGFTFEESDFWLDISSVQIGPEIGSGQFSTVYIGKYFGDYVAVKKQTREDVNLDSYLLRELAVLKNASHKNLVQYIGACNQIAQNEFALNVLYIVTEFCQGGDLLGLLLSDKDLGWKFRIKIASDAASALKYLHRHNLIHRDIKSSNMLLDHNWVCKISDFGMARDFRGGNTDDNDYNIPPGQALHRRMTICGTNEYMAPELMFDEEYGSGVDVFSFGMVLLEIIKRYQVGKGKFARRLPQNGFVIDREAVEAELPDDAPPSLVMLALQCCEYEPSDRPFSDDVYDWLSDLYESFPDDIVPRPPLAPVAEFADNSQPPSPRAVLSPPNSDGPSAVPSPPKEMPSEAALREMYTLNEGAHNVILKAGFIFKRNKTGFRNWKFRWLVLTPYQLRWYASMTDRVEKGHIELLDARVKKTKQYRFVVLDPDEGFDPDESRFNHIQYHREFSADGDEPMEEWISAIQLAVDNYQRLRTATRMNVAAPSRHNSTLYSSTILKPADRPPKNEAEDVAGRLCSEANAGMPVSVTNWLHVLKLDQYANNFISRGYDSMQHIKDFGIHNDDLDYMGINHPLHRRVLKIAAISEYSEVLLTGIQDWQEIGSVVVYKVVSRWRFSRSCVFLRFGEFKKLHSNILKSLTGPECAKLLSKLPDLPGIQPSDMCSMINGKSSAGKGNMVIQSRSAAFCTQRRLALEAYLITLSSLLSGTPIMRILLEAIGLSPRSVDASIVANKRDRSSVFSHVSTEVQL